jgi:hypothetical protein
VSWCRRMSGSPQPPKSVTFRRIPLPLPLLAPDCADAFSLSLLVLSFIPQRLRRSSYVTALLLKGYPQILAVRTAGWTGTPDPIR